MAAKDTGIVVLMLTGWQDHLARAARRAHKDLAEGRLMRRMRKFTLLAVLREFH